MARGALVTLKVPSQSHVISFSILFSTAYNFQRLEKGRERKERGKLFKAGNEEKRTRLGEEGRAADES